MQKPCCQDARNLGPVQRDPQAGPGETYRRCQVCGCRQFTVTLVPLVYGIRSPGTPRPERQV
jgi:hypothetical protein